MGSELHRVGQKVDQHLFDRPSVCIELHGFFDARLNCDVLFVCLQRNHAHGFIDQRAEVDFFTVEREMARFDL
ncbi:hypothetical protein D9M69_727370 [compost metagenome]